MDVEGYCTLLSHLDARAVRGFRLPTRLSRSAAHFHSPAARRLRLSGFLRGLRSAAIDISLGRDDAKASSPSRSSSLSWLLSRQQQHQHGPTFFHSSPLRRQQSSPFYRQATSSSLKLESLKKPRGRHHEKHRKPTATFGPTSRRYGASGLSTLPDLCRRGREPYYARRWKRSEICFAQTSVRLESGRKASVYFRCRFPPPLNVPSSVLPEARVMLLASRRRQTRGVAE